jgi:hypothetical protein
MSKRPYLYIIMAITILIVFSWNGQTQHVESEIAYTTTNNYPGHFSAEVQTTFLTGTQWLTKVYKEGYLLRTDVAYNIYKHTIITNLETRASTAIFPDNSQFQRWKFISTNLETTIDDSLYETENFGGTHTFVGEEIVDGISCNKFAVTYHANSETGPEKNGTSWIDKRTNSPVKVQLDDRVSFVKNVKIAQQDSKIFEVPKGYHEYQPSL